MKSWGWFLLFILAILASIYLWKKPNNTNSTATEQVPQALDASPAPLGGPPPGSAPSRPGIPVPRTMPNPSGMGGPVPNQENTYREPEMTPPPSPSFPSSPEIEPPEYFDGDPIPPPFEPPPPLDESFGTPPPPAPVPELEGAE